MRLIDADATAAKIMMEAPDFMDGGSSITKAFILAMVKTSSVTPTIDAVQVVRCKNCREQIGCTIYLEAVEADNENWFCASGVAKEGDDHEETVAGGG